MLYAKRIENFPGFPEGISGMQLAELMEKQVAKFGLEIRYAETTGLVPQEFNNVVKTSEGDFSGRAVILSGGSEHVKLSVPGEEQFVGRGVSYCATCDAAFFGDQVVAVVGGGDTALTEALYLTRFASRVFIIHRRNEFRAMPLLQERALAEPKVTVIWDTVVQQVLGQEQVHGLELRNVKTGEVSSLKVNGLFVAIGVRPNTDYLRGVVKLDELGQVVTDNHLETDRPGIFAAGDIRSNSGRQAIIAAGDGAAAALFAQGFLRRG
jgi:thioredoxin reductase (NADPH)